MTESQIKAWENAKDKLEIHRKVESSHPGFLVIQNTFYSSTIKRVGRICYQTAIDI